MPEPKIANPFQIDPDLWAEWSRMPSQTRDAGVRVADARHLYNVAKAKVDVERARLFHAIRKNPGHYDLADGKAPSNEVTETRVQIEPSYIKLVDEMNLRKKELDYTEADAEAFLTKRKTLENMVELVALDYHADREPRPLSGESRDRMERRKRDAGGGVDVDS